MEESHRCASRAGAPQKGRASSVINRFMRAAREKRLLVLSALSTTCLPSQSHMAARGDVSSEVFSFSARAVPTG